MELTKSQKVFSEKLDHLSRRLAWVHATVYSQVSRCGLGQWLLLSPVSLASQRLGRAVPAP